MRGKARSRGRKEPECSATTPPLTAGAQGLSSLGLGFTVFGTCELAEFRVCDALFAGSRVPAGRGQHSSAS